MISLLNIPYIYHIDSGKQGLNSNNNYKYYLISFTNNKYIFTEIDYINNLKRIYSLIYLSTLPNDNPNYINNNYIGDFEIYTDPSNGIQSIIGIKNTMDNNLFLDDTIYTFNSNLVNNLTQDLDSFIIFKVYKNDISGKSYTKIEFDSTVNSTSEMELKLYINSNNNDEYIDYIQKYFIIDNQNNENKVKLPIKLILNSLGNGVTHYRYGFYIYKINKNIDNTNPVICYLYFFINTSKVILIMVYHLLII